MPAVIRLAVADDADQIQKIYAPIVRDTAISFELEIPSVSEMQHRILSTLEKMPWLFCENNGAVLGYAYAGSHRSRAAYQWSVDVSVYVDANYRGKRVGQALYRSLFDLLVLQGFRTAYAGITLPNAASVGLHESLGFLPVGIYRSVGYKLDSWHDVGWYLTINHDDSAPATPLLLPEAMGSSEWDVAMNSGLPLLRL